MSKLLRVKDAAHFLAVSKSQVWKLTQDGILKSYKLSDRVTVWKIEELEQFIASKIGA
ncbi:MAG: helix-turn-helix domain-containing protein [Sulfurimonas sp.]|nr:helix-turn-helix domain-containing protein [Sulfurimonas sp.]